MNFSFNTTVSHHQSLTKVIPLKLRFTLNILFGAARILLVFPKKNIKLRIE